MLAIRPPKKNRRIGFERFAGVFFCVCPFINEHLAKLIERYNGRDNPTRKTDILQTSHMQIAWVNHFVIRRLPSHASFLLAVRSNAVE